MKAVCLFIFVFVFGGVNSLSICKTLQKLLIDDSACSHDRNLNLDVSKINVYLYNFPKFEGKKFTIEKAADGILSIKGLDIRRKFIIFVGGFTSDINTKTEKQVRNTIRNFTNSYLIIVNHSSYTHNKKLVDTNKNYLRSVKYVHYIGKALGNMLAKLSAGGISPKNIHGVGHSLGSHILGQTGEVFFNSTGKKVWRITGLDPAGPCFTKSLMQEQIRHGVAEYVEVYHCNAGELGTRSVIADVNFFANHKGKSQPDCDLCTCSHSACVDIWLATVAQPKWFMARQCDSYEKFKEGNCPTNRTTIAGFGNPGTATGRYYFSTEGYKFKRN